MLGSLDADRVAVLYDLGEEAAVRQALERADMTPNGFLRLRPGPLLLGLAVGLIFGSVNLWMTWLDPLAEDTPGVLLEFYGPMFFVWALASFLAARRTGRLLSGVVTGLIVAFTTFLTFDFLILVRVNLLLHQLTGRADWQNMIRRFQASDIESLRLFINIDYFADAPLKLAVSCAIGAVMGTVGGFLGQLTRRFVVSSGASLLDG
jgi:hypothetical protein